MNALPVGFKSISPSSYGFVRGTAALPRDEAVAILRRVFMWGLPKSSKTDSVALSDGEFVVTLSGKQHETAVGFQGGEFALYVRDRSKGNV